MQCAGTPPGYIYFEWSMLQVSDFLRAVTGREITSILYCLNPKSTFRIASRQLQSGTVCISESKSRNMGSLSTGMQDPNPLCITVSREKLVSYKLSRKNLESVIRTLHHDGFVVLEDVITRHSHLTTCEGYSDVRFRADRENIRNGPLRSESRNAQYN